MLQQCIMFSRQSSMFNQLIRRSIHFGQTMTTQEVATALRPFIFIVHPDRFWNFPKEKDTNELSLKRLNEFLDDKLRHKSMETQQTITFYVRNGESKNQSEKNDIELMKVDINLSSKENVNTTVHKILSKCSLPTDYLQKIGKTPNVKRESTENPIDSHPFYRKGNEYFYTKDLFDKMEGDIAKTKMEVNLTDFLKSNYLSALKKIEASRPIQTELRRLREELIMDLKLLHLDWDCDWGFSHMRGCLKNITVLNKQYPNDMAKLSGKTIIFSRDSGIGLDGQIVLSIEDVRNSWLDLIRSIKDFDPYVIRLPVEEKILSDLLRGISIVRPNNIQIAKKYVNQLTKFSKTIYRYVENNTTIFPEVWPQSLGEYRLIVESDSGPLMLSKEGYFIVPASCPASLFVRFITDNLSKASQTLRMDEKNLMKEKRIIDECIVVFGLEGLDKDENIIPEQMIDFGQRLLSMKDHFRPYLKGLHVRVSMYYSVLHDGQICVPFNFIPRS